MNATLCISVAPTGVELEGGRGEMIVGRTYTITCVVYGSRPPPVITWFLNMHRLG